MINLLDPSSLPKSQSEGPMSWGEAWSRAAETTDETMRVIENTNAGSDALERAYDERIALIRDLTDVELPNPMRVASTVDRDMADVLAAQAGGGGTALPSQVSPDYLRRQEEEFNARAAALAERDPKIAGILSRPILEQRNKVMRDAEGEAALAAEAPELGMFGRLTAQLTGGLSGSARDPAQIGMAFLGAGGSVAKTVAGRIGQTVMTEALINGGQELVLQGISQERKREAGLEHGMSDMLANAGIAATFGALFGGTVQGGMELARVFKLGDGGEKIAARVLEGRPEPGDVETMAKAMGVDLGPDQLGLITRSFEERVLDDVMVRPDATPGELRVFEAAQRYAEDPDNFPAPDLVERLVAEEEAGRMQFSPDQYERMFAGDQNAIDDIADTFFADSVDDAARRIDAIETRVDRLTDDVVTEDQSASVNDRRSADPIDGQAIRPQSAAEPLDAAEAAADVQMGDIVEPARDANGNPENYLDFIGIEDGDGNVKIMSTPEALAMADEPDLLADVLESCKL